ncbi:fimbrial protein [Burkholderia sp. RF7-non_BP1]|nr:fimbrial protein [Burkholderia sp. RF7-non_BP1]KUY93382.1 fimbrial protein [Burkholderia sp. RF7-non_BP4]
MRRRTSLPQENRPKLKSICAACLIAMAGWQAESAYATTQQLAQTEFAQVEFQGGFLNNASGGIDVSRYARGNVVRAGKYIPDVYVDGRWIGRFELTFKSAPGVADAQPCFDQSMLETIGIDVEQLSEEVRTTLGRPGACMRVGEALPEASVEFDFGNQRVDLSIPQASLRRHARDAVNPDQWSAGAPVAMLGYNVNVYNSHVKGAASNTQGYVGLDGGFNFQRWHFRHSGSMNVDNRGRTRYEAVSTYAQRDLTSWMSQLVIGESYTSGDLFDSTSFRGVRVYTDDRMLPESQRGYAPVVRGVANTNAKVTVMQNGVKLYETTVAPGAFIIDDLYPTGYGGDLHVSVMEADGSVHSFTVPYAAVPLSLRPGQNRYSFTAGFVRNLPETTPFFTQATWQHGFTNMLTGYGGATVADGYAAAMIGGVLNTSWGAFGVDVTHAVTSIPRERRYSGQSVRINYAKQIDTTGTNIAIAAYRYSTDGFFGLNDAMSARDQAKVFMGSAGIYRQRNRMSFTMSQQLGNKGGSLNVTASAMTYWNRGGSDVDYTIGYNNSFRDVSYNLSATRQRDAWGRSSTLLYAGLTIPLGSKRPAMLSLNFNRDTQGSTRAQTSLSGALGREGNFSYGVNVDHDASRGRSQTAGGANAMYRGSIADVSGSFGVSTDFQQFSLGLRGAMVAHPGGVTLSQPLSETFAIVKAPHAEGARVTNMSGVRVGRNGYAVVPFLSPFRMNEITLDPKGLSTDVELQETSQRVAPLAGAVPLLEFRTTFGRSAVIRMHRPDGAPVPFGASVVDQDGADIGVVGQGGKLFARGLSERGDLFVEWNGSGEKSLCKVSYALPERPARRGRGAGGLPQRVELPCVSVEHADYRPNLSTGDSVQPS